MITKRERIQAVLAGEPVDRPPVAFWRHWPGDDQDPERLAEVTVAFHRRYDWDFAKVTPSSSYVAEGWGAQTTYAGTSPIGEREYVVRPVSDPSDWSSIQPLDVESSPMARQLATVRSVRAQLGADVPLLMTVFSPLSIARTLVGDDRFLAHVRLHPREVHVALEAIAVTFQRFIDAVLEHADGVFFSTAAAAYSVMSEGEYREVGLPYDLRMLEPVSAGWFNVLHLHSPYPMMGLAQEYPVQAVNWDDRSTEPGLEEGQQLVNKTVMGCVSQWGPLLQGTPDDVRAEARGAVRACGGRGMMVTAGCTYPLAVPEGNLQAARHVVDQPAD